MIVLAKTHPTQLVLGALLIAADMAEQNRQLTLGSLCETALEWADSACATFKLIARDAGDGELLVSEVARDGIITPTEASQITRQFEKIEQRAINGSI